ncbi:MAG TPA: spore germination protein GerW family protein [Fimbriimonadaceae bacterium]|nr:spore germination protein GerW family protein [Fimbriimonadaceae bacterium]
MSEHESFDGMVTSLKDSASVRNVYGDPVRAGEKTIIPVANIAYGFGGGEDKDHDGGFGGGGGMRARPVGVVEITNGETRWVPLNPAKTLMIAGGIGFLVGMVMGGRKAKRRYRRQEEEDED